MYSLYFVMHSRSVSCMTGHSYYVCMHVCMRGSRNEVTCDRTLIRKPEASPMRALPLLSWFPIASTSWQQNNINNLLYITTSLKQQNVFYRATLCWCGIMRWPCVSVSVCVCLCLSQVGNIFRMFKDTVFKLWARAIGTTSFYMTNCPRNGRG